MPTSWGSWARSGVTMAQGWTGTLTICNIDGPMVGGTFSTWGAGQRSQVEGMGCTAGIEVWGSGILKCWSDGVWSGLPTSPWPADAIAAVNTWLSDTVAPPLTGNEATYTVLRCYLTTPGGTVSSYHVTGIWRAKEFMYPPPPPVSEPWTWVGPFTSISATYNLYLDGVRLWARVGTANPTSRNVRDFIDFVREDAWRGESGVTTSGGTLVTPTGTLSSSGSWGSHPGGSDGELDAGWVAALQLGYSLEVDSTAVIGTDYATIAPQWGGIALKLDKLDDRYYSGAWHHKPYPTSGWPPASWEWQADEQSGAISLRRHDATAVDGAWTGYSLPPYIVKLTAEVGKWSAVCGDFTPPLELDFADYKDDSGAALTLGNGVSDWITEGVHSWYTEDRISSDVTCDVNEEWMRDAGEYVSASPTVGSVEYALTDMPVGLACWGLPESSYQGSPYVDSSTYIVAGKQAVNVHRAQGAAAHLAWAATGGASITSCDETTLVLEVPAGATAPAISAPIRSRYWAQMGRLAERVDDPENAHKADWPIYLRANIDTDVGGAIPAGDPLHDDLVAEEDVFNYDNASYLQFKANHARAGALKVALGYNELETVDDPCYTCFEHRYGEDGEFSYSKGPDLIASYENDYIGAPMTGTGEQTWYIDLRCPAEGDLTRGALQHVSSIMLSGFPVPTTGTDTWTIHVGELNLVAGTLKTKAKRAWNWGENFFGLSALVDGASVLAIRYGYEDMEAQERGLKYQQLVRHCPNSEATGDLSTCKTLSRLADELGWQEGFTAQYQAGAVAARFQDSAGNALFTDATAFWWWLAWEPDGALPIDAAPLIRTWHIIRGVPYNFHVRHYLRGRLHGLLKDGSGMFRARSASPAVSVYSAGIGDPDTLTLLGTYGSDADGRWLSDPVAELGYVYTVEIGGESRGGLQATNRSYTEAPAQIVTEGSGLQMFTDPTGVAWQVWQDGANIYCNCLQAGNTTWCMPMLVTSGAANYDSPAITGNGRTMHVSARHKATHQPYAWHSLDAGHTWTGPTASG